MKMTDNFIIEYRRERRQTTGSNGAAVVDVNLTHQSTLVSNVHYYRINISLAQSFLNWREPSLRGATHSHTSTHKKHTRRRASVVTIAIDHSPFLLFVASSSPNVCECKNASFQALLRILMCLHYSSFELKKFDKKVAVCVEWIRSIASVWVSTNRFQRSLVLARHETLQHRLFTTVWRKLNFQFRFDRISNEAKSHGKTEKKEKKSKIFCDTRNQLKSVEARVVKMHAPKPANVSNFHLHFLIATMSFVRICNYAIRNSLHAEHERRWIGGAREGMISGNADALNGRLNSRWNCVQ